MDSFLQQSTAAIGEGCRQQQSLTTHNKILLLILFLLVHWVLNIVYEYIYIHTNTNNDDLLLPSFHFLIKKITFYVAYKIANTSM